MATGGDTKGTAKKFEELTQQQKQQLEVKKVAPSQNKLTPREKQLAREAEWAAEKERKKQEEERKKQEAIEAMKRAQEGEQKTKEKIILAHSEEEVLNKSRAEKAKKEEFKSKFEHFDQGPQPVNTPEKAQPVVDVDVKGIKNKFQ
eukprot:TRINITY_DN2975_c0_g1_i1.p1 TRINITY_DN2975_c0_g1~~TRINITY_DN2975_c0_g1_i1.p1  ORF type:complete len:160 (+),score=66.60 TRINITY_DN2975_c0_g1_i1:45-482(+)